MRYPAPDMLRMHLPAAAGGVAPRYGGAMPALRLARLARISILSASRRCLGALLGLTLAAATAWGAGSLASPTSTPSEQDWHLTQHVFTIMQENRSFYNYFGSFPGADGIPIDANGAPAVCAPDPQSGQCVAPYHDPNDLNRGGPHTPQDSAQDVDG